MENIEKFKDAICDYFNVSWIQIENKNNSSKVSNARNFTYYSMHYYLGMSISQISTLLKRAERGVKQRISNMKYLIENQKKYNRQYNELIDALKNANI